MCSELEIQETSEGAIIRVRVVPRAKQTALDGVQNGALKVRLNAPPVDGAANKELTAFLAKQLGCRKSDVRIVAGERSRVKTVLLRNAWAGDLRNAMTD